MKPHIYGTGGIFKSYDSKKRETKIFLTHVREGYILIIKSSLPYQHFYPTIYSANGFLHIKTNIFTNIKTKDWRIVKDWRNHR